MHNTIQFSLPQTIVSNDTASLKAFSNVSSCIEQLSNERDEWEKNSLRTSNEQLYVLLQRCYAFYKSIEGPTNEAANRRAALNRYIAEKEYKFLKSTHTIQKIVRCVFNSDRHRVSTYGIALRSVLEKNIAVDNVADYIRQCGGVEEMRLKKSPIGKSTKDKAQFAAAEILKHKIAVVKSPSLNSSVDAGKADTNVVLIGTWQADGSIVVRSIVESDTALTAALASHYNTIKSSDTLQQQETAVKIMTDAQQNAINDAFETALAA